MIYARTIIRAIRIAAFVLRCLNALDEMNNNQTSSTQPIQKLEKEKQTPKK